MASFNESSLETEVLCENFVASLNVQAGAGEGVGAGSGDFVKDQVLERLSKIVGNALAQPENAKYRSVPLSNEFIADMVAKAPQAMEYLEILGFHNNTKGDYVLERSSQDEKVLKTGLEVLQKNLNMNSNSNLSKLHPEVEESKAGSFDIYSPSVLKLGKTLPKSITESLGSNTALEEKVEKIKQENYQKILAAGIPDRLLAVYPRSEEKLFKERARVRVAMELELEPQSQHEDLENEEKSEVVKLSDIKAKKSYGARVLLKAKKNEDMELIAAAAKSQQEKSKAASKFQTKAMREMKSLQGKTIYTQTTIKVQFPDHMIVQANFSPLERVADVETLLIRTMDKPEKSKFTLYQPSRMTRSNLNSDATLSELGLVPGARIFARWVNDAPEGDYFREELLNTETIEQETVSGAKSTDRKAKKFFSFRK